MLIFLGKETHSETKSWKSSRIVDEKSYNNNGKPWKSSSLTLRVNCCFFYFVFLCSSFFCVFFCVFFFVFSFFVFFIFVMFLFFSFFHFLSFCFIYFIFFHVLSYCFMFFHFVVIFLSFCCHFVHFLSLFFHFLVIFFVFSFILLCVCCSDFFGATISLRFLLTVLFSYFFFSRCFFIFFHFFIF